MGWGYISFKLPQGRNYFRVDKKKREKRRKKEEKELEREERSQKKQHMHKEVKKVAVMTKEEHGDQLWLILRTDIAGPGQEMSL